LATGWDFDSSAAFSVGQDRGITLDDVRKFEQQLKQLGKKVEIKIYDDAGHAFEHLIE